MNIPCSSRTVSNDHRHYSCPFCKSKNIYGIGRIFYSSPILFSTTSITTSRAPELWGCHQCQSRFTQNSIPEQDAIELYSIGKSIDRWKAPKFIEHHCPEVVEEIEISLIQDHFVVDVGCNTGEFLDFALSKKCKTGGIEFSNDSRTILEEKGHSTYPNLGELENSSVDVITAFDLVEHLYNPAEFIAQCHNKLKPGGKLYIVTGNALCISARLSKEHWWYVSYPEHIVFPSKKYFLKYSPFRLEQIIKTYAGKSYKRPSREVVYPAIRGLLSGSYNASPSIGPDHMLVTLKKY